MASQPAYQIQALPDPDHPKVAAFLKLATRMGWEIVSVNDLGINLKRKKTFGSGYLLFGALTAVVLVGFLIWIVGLFDYLASNDKVLFIPHSDLEGERALITADLLV